MTEPDRKAEDVERTEALVRRAREEGADSFGELYGRVAPALFTWASLRVKPALRSRLDPEDLVQETCVRAYRGFDGYDPERGNFRAWLFGIANHVLQRALLNLSKGPGDARHALADEVTSFIQQIPDEATRASRLAARSDSLEVFIEAAGSLGEEERKLLLYRGLEGLPHHEVAEIMGIETETAKKRWQRLRGRLQEMKAPDELL